MNKIFIFDVDGTLTPSRRRMTEDFARFFDDWSKENMILSYCSFLKGSLSVSQASCIARNLSFSPPASG